MRKLIEVLERTSARLAELPWNRRCVLFSTGGVGGYWKFHTGPEFGLTANIEEAHVFNIQAIRMMSIGSTTQIQLFDEVASKDRLCLIGQVLPPTVLEMLKVAPMNETARAHVLKQFKFGLPPECQTFEQITEWVEKNVDPSKVSPVFAEAEPPPGRQDLAQLIALTGQRHYEQPAFYIHAALRGTETGRCNYSALVAGEGDVEITTRELTACIRDCLDRGGSFESLVAEVQIRVRNKGRNEISTGVNDGSYTYSDHESDNDNIDVDIGEDDLREAIIQWMEDNDADSLEQIDNNG